MANLTKSLDIKAAQIAARIVRMSTSAGSGHPSSALSLVHIVTVLMYQKMRYDPLNPFDPGRDMLVLSEGHAVPVIYAAYADLGGAVGPDPEHLQPLKDAQLDSLREFESLLDGHPNPAEGFSFLPMATGSLGQGLSMAAGMALAAKLNNSDQRIYCICGDGESREGQVAEALDFIIDFKLDNVVTIFNCNGQGQSQPVSAQQSPAALSKKLAAFGFDSHILDGHDVDELLEHLSLPSRGVPLALCAKTTKGWGSSNLEKGNWHGKTLPADHLDKAIAEYNQAINRLNEIPGKVIDPRPPKPAPAEQPAGHRKKILLNAENVLKDQADYTSGKGIATRKAYGLALKALGQAGEDVVALDGDVKNSTHSQLFFEQFPERAFESRIAEQNMISAAAGLARMGKIPFVSTFGKFLARTYDQIEMAMISQADIKIVGSHCGITAASDGPSQMALSDLAWFSALASVTRKDGRRGCTVLQPADAVAAVMLTELMANHPGMFYMRTARPAVPNVYTPEQQFAPGKVKTVLKGGDLAIISAGFMLHQAIKAAQILKDKHISASVVDAYCIPIDDDQILATAAENNNLLLTVEDNYGHGLAAQVASIAAAKGDITVNSMTVRQIPKSTRDINQLLGHLGLDAESIAAAARKMLSK